jgi:hypothetical protein
MKSDKDTPPTANELEVSIFGPGYGECIVVHYGAGKWLIIDSCIDPGNKRPVALSYLERLGVDASAAVTLVAATHWHDDHIRGLAAIVNTCTNAQFCCSGALRSADFFRLGQLYSTAPIGMPSGPSEFNKIFGTIVARKGQSQYKPIKFSMDGHILLRERQNISGEFVEVVLQSLSPSDEMLTRAAKELAESWAFVTSGTVSRMIPNHPNHVSVAMMLEIGSRSILLGSDLEETGDPLTGWAAVCDSPTRNEQKASVFKVAHHGSISGFNALVWSKMLEHSPLSLITPFRRGWHKMPTIADQAQILALTKEAYLTADPQKSRSPKKRAPKIEALMRAVTIERRLSIESVGHIRWRASISDTTDTGTISLFDGAYKLEERPSS